MDRRYDLLFALSILAFGLIIVLMAKAMPPGIYRDAIGSKGFFYAIGIFFMIGSAMVVMNLIRSWKKHKSHMIPAEGETDEEGHPVYPLMAATVVAISILYAFLLKPLGYLITTPIYIAAGMAILKERKWGWIVLFAVGFTIAFYLAFGQVLHMPIPVGPFTTLFRNLGWINI